MQSFEWDVIFNEVYYLTIGNVIESKQKERKIENEMCQSLFQSNAIIFLNP